MAMPKESYQSLIQSLSKFPVITGEHPVSATGSEVEVLPSGFVDLAPFEEVIPERLKLLPETEFVSWAKERAQSPTEIGYDIATFQKGRNGGWNTYDLKQTGILRSPVENLVISPGLPYVIRVDGETPNAGDGKGAYFVDVLRRPNLEDLVDYSDYLKEADPREVHLQRSRWFANVEFSADAKGKIIGYAWKPGRRYDRVVPDWNAYRQPNSHSVWAGMGVERGNVKTFFPILEAKDWERTRVALTSSEIPVVRWQKYLGIELEYRNNTLVDSPAALEKFMPMLPKVEQGILARLWNIYWQNKDWGKLVSLVLEKIRSQGTK